MGLKESKPNNKGESMSKKYRSNPKYPFGSPQKRDHLKLGIEVQGYGYDTQGNPLCAGVHFVPELSAKWIWRIVQHWKRWRKWYDNRPENRKRAYPAKGNDLIIGLYGIHPIGKPSASQWLKVATGETVNP